nr:integrase, catalytic region, zinc finger, CCHC-type, peptidase aspartic, catalytic [Tanacetum cinerariifolium]
MSVKYPNYVNLTSSSEEQPNKRTPSPPPRKKSLSPPQAPSKSISSKSTHYTSSSSPSESPTPNHVAPLPKLRFVILIKQEPQELPLLQMSPNDPYAQTMDNWPSGPSNPYLPPRVSRPPFGFLNPPPKFKPLPSTHPFFVNINNNIPYLHNNAPSLENIYNPPQNLRNKDFLKPLNVVLWIVDSGCSKHMTGNLQLLKNFVEQFMGTVRFRNDHFAAITGYRDNVQGNLTICHVYYVEGLGHNLFSLRQFCDGDLEMKPKADIGIFVGYSDSSCGFCIYNHRTKKIMETIYVKFDEFTAMASECDNLEPIMNCVNFNDLSEYSQFVPSTTDLVNLFSPMYEKYYVMSSQDVSDNSAANTLDNDHTSSSSSIAVDQDDAPPIVVSSEEQVVTEPNTPVLNEVAD